jgi:hypothetical protein
LLIAYIAFFSELLPIIFYLVFLKRNRGEGLWVIFLYCVLSVLTEILGGIFRLPIIFAIFNIVQFTLFSIFCYSSLKNKIFKYIVIFGAVVFCAVSISNFNTIKLDSISLSLASIFFIPYCIILLYEQIRDTDIMVVYNNKKFWIIIAFFLNFSGTLFLYLYFKQLSEAQQQSYWQINNFFEIIKNILFCVSFIMKKRPKNEYTLETLDN